MKREPLIFVLTAIALIGASGLHLLLLWPHTSVADNDFDAVHLYLPLASQLVVDGLRFFADEKSLQAPVFSYLYPAVLGRSLPTLKVVNALLSGVTLLLVFRTAWLAHSRMAGLIAAFLFAGSPLLRFFLAAPTTEPPFILLNALWIWGLAEWLAWRRPSAIAISALALALAALTRGTIFYWILVLIVFFSWLAWRSKPEDRHAAKGALIAYLASLALPGVFIAKNMLFFGFPFFATGAGNALYLGNNPVTGGYDPNYLGLLFDVGSIARDQSPLTLEAERLLGGVGRFMIADQSPAFLVSMHLKKLAAFVFVTNAEANAGVWRTWRIALLVLSTIGASVVRDRWLRWMLVGILLYQVAVHVPVLYTHRYSVSSMDLWLVILGSIGVASLFRHGKAFSAGATLLVIVIAVAIGQYVWRRGGPPEPDVFRAARIHIWEATPFQHDFGRESSPVEIAVKSRSHPFHPWYNYALVIEARIDSKATKTTCGPLKISYKRERDSDFSRPVLRAILPGESTQLRQIGGLQLNLNADGKLRLDMECKLPTALKLSRLAIYAPMGSIDYRERYLREPPLFSGAFER